MQWVLLRPPPVPAPRPGLLSGGGDAEDALPRPAHSPPLGRSPWGRVGRSVSPPLPGPPAAVGWTQAGMAQSPWHPHPTRADSPPPPQGRRDGGVAAHGVPGRGGGNRPRPEPASSWPRPPPARPRRLGSRLQNHFLRPGARSRGREGAGPRGGRAGLGPASGIAASRPHAPGRSGPFSRRPRGRAVRRVAGAGERSIQAVRVCVVRP